MWFFNIMNRILKSLAPDSIFTDTLFTQVDSVNVPGTLQNGTNLLLPVVITLVSAVLLYLFVRWMIRLIEIKTGKSLWDDGVYASSVHIVFLAGVYYIVAVHWLSLSSLTHMIILGMLSVILLITVHPVVFSIVAGMILSFTAPFRKNDIVHIGSHRGRVKKHTLMNIILTDMTGSEVYIPNHYFFRETFTNITAGRQIMPVEFKIAVTTQTSFTQLREVVKEITLSAPYIYLDEPVHVHLEYTSDGRPVLVVRAFVMSPDYLDPFRSYLTEMLYTVVRD